MISGGLILVHKIRCFVSYFTVSWSECIVLFSFPVKSPDRKQYRLSIGRRMEFRVLWSPPNIGYGQQLHLRKGRDPCDEVGVRRLKWQPVKSHRRNLNVGTKLPIPPVMQQRVDAEVNALVDHFASLVRAARVRWVYLKSDRVLRSRYSRKQWLRS